MESVKLYISRASITTQHFWMLCQIALLLSHLISSHDRHVGVNDEITKMG